MDHPGAAPAAAVQPVDPGPDAAALFLVPSMDGLFEFVVERRFCRVRHFSERVHRSAVWLGGAALAGLRRRLDARLLRARVSARLSDLSAVSRAGVVLRAVHRADADRADRYLLHGADAARPQWPAQRLLVEAYRPERAGVVAVQSGYRAADRDASRHLELDAVLVHHHACRLGVAAEGAGRGGANPRGIVLAHLLGGAAAAAAAGDPAGAGAALSRCDGRVSDHLGIAAGRPRHRHRNRGRLYLHHDLAGF